jgi:cellulose synthase/poly-beta-1,6-N-acetylglucosamine synthase-like glycosyltransferase
MHAEHVDAHVIIVDNASELPLEVPEAASLVKLPERQTIGGARNAGLACVTTPYVVFADADDEVAPGSLSCNLALLHRHPDAAGVIGRSIVVEDGRHRRRGRTPRTGFRLASRYVPSIAPLFWLTACQCSITSTVLRTATVLDAGGFPDTDIAEDWHLAARLARRGPFICLDEPVRIYHRHPNAARNTNRHPSTTTLRGTICTDYITTPHAPLAHRLIAYAIRGVARRAH